MKLPERQIVIPFLMVLVFFCGGLFLDYRVSTMTLDLAVNPDATETNKALVDWSKRLADNLNTSAKVLYDFAKISLGVLLASFTRSVATTDDAKG